MGSAKKQGELWGQSTSDWVQYMEPTALPLFEAMLNAANVTEGTRFLDAGCGGGGASVLAAQRNAQVSGLDAAEAFINIAGERVPSGDFRVGDIEDLPFEDGTFDAVIAANALQFAENHVGALRELGRVCTAEGRIVVGLFGPPDKVEYSNILKALGKAMPNPPKGGGPFALSGPEVLENLIDDAGLTILESNEVNCPFHFAEYEAFWLAVASAGPFQAAMLTVGEDQLKAIFREVTSTYTTDDGRIEIAPNMFKYVVAAPST
jgi:SAM-dependent methyltransferase